MDVRRALDIIYEQLELDIDNEVGEAWQTLEDYCTQLTDLQQLNVAIDLLKDMVKTWDVHGVIHNDSYYYERANTIIATRAKEKE